MCRSAWVNNHIPLQNLWLSCKTIYHEAMPTYFRTRSFKFNNIERLGAFLMVIGPHPRQYLTSVRFRYEKAGATAAFEVHEAFRLLGECPNLSQLSFTAWCHYLMRKNRSLPGMSTLLKIRGIEKLDIDFDSFYNASYPYNPDPSDVDNAKKCFISKMSILKEPYKAAEMKRREAKGIVKFAEPRMDFTPKAESRAERVSRRRQLKEIA